MGCSTAEVFLENLTGLIGEKNNKLNINDNESASGCQKVKDSLKVTHCALVKILEEKPKNYQRLCNKILEKDSNTENVIKSIYTHLPILFAILITY